jgi:hypothetical protein
VSDWINIGDTGRMRAWLLAMAVAIAGVLVLQATGAATLPADTFPPYRTPTFAWLRYLLGGFLFGIGMTLASGCGSKTLIRLGGGSLKSLIALMAAAICAYLMIWTPFYGSPSTPGLRRPRSILRSTACAARRWAIWSQGSRAWAMERCSTSGSAGWLLPPSPYSFSRRAISARASTTCSVASWWV